MIVVLHMKNVATSPRRPRWTTFPSNTPFCRLPPSSHTSSWLPSASSCLPQSTSGANRQIGCQPRVVPSIASVP